MQTLFRDLHYGLRALLKNPGFTAIAVVTLALGIGANTAMFSVMNAVLFRPLPFPDQDRLVAVWQIDSKGVRRSLSPPAFAHLRDHNDVLMHMATYGGVALHLTGGDEPEYDQAWMASASLFPLLGVKAVLGRTFMPEEYQPGGERVVVLSHGLWQRRFGGNPSAIGRTVKLNNEAYTVVGVLPRDFWFFHGHYDLWLPMSDRQPSGPLALARLKAGVTLQQAQAQLDTIARQLDQESPSTNQGLRVRVAALHDWHQTLLGDRRSAFPLLLGAVGFLLLIACANVANLLLARAVTRQKEIAIRRALGAGRFRLMRQLLTESLLLAFLGGILGLILASWGTALVVALIPGPVQWHILGGTETIGIDRPVLGFTLGISLLAGMVFGLAPALQTSRTPLNELLKEGGRSAVESSRGHKTRSLLVISEVALALVLLIGAGLMIRSFLRLGKVDLGFNPKNVLVMWLMPLEYKHREEIQRSTFYSQVLERIETLPGVQSVSAASLRPEQMERERPGPFIIEGSPALMPGEAPVAINIVISANYFLTMGIPLRKGRYFHERDTAGAPGAVIISETIARRFWPAQDPIGKRIQIEGSQAPAPWFSIVGVVGDVRLPKTGPIPILYYSILQNPGFDTHLLVRSAADPSRLAAAVKKEVWAVEKDQPFVEPETMEQMLSVSTSQEHFTMGLLGAFATVALILAAVGIYGVMAYAVNRRTHEFGIRMALGAQRSDVLKLVLGRALRLILIGVATGVTAAIALTRLIASQLYGITATDPATFAGVSLLLAGVAMLASYLPARRATQVDPMVALRYE